MSSHPAPPAELSSPLELDPSDWQPRAVQRLFAGLVAPRPIGWISTIDSAGVRNLAPHSYFNVIATDPPHVVFSSTGFKDTLRNVREIGQFVVNIVTMDLLEIMNASSTDLPPDVDEFDWLGIVAAPSVVVEPPRVAAARAHLECKVVHELQAGNGQLIVGEVLHVHIDPTVWTEGGVDIHRLQPVTRLGGALYAKVGEIIELARVKWQDVEDAAHEDRIPRISAS